jgi:hypothetical protein
LKGIFSMKNDVYDVVLLSMENFHHDKGVLHPPPLPPPLSIFLTM